MENTSKDLLQLEHKQPSSSIEAALLVCRDKRKSLQERPTSEGKPFTAPLPKSQVLGKVKDFLGVISEANKNLELNAKDKPEEYNIEVLDGNKSEYIEMDLMLGVADLHTSEAVEAAEVAIAGNQPIFNLPATGNFESDSSSDDDDDDDDNNDRSDKDEHWNTSSSREKSEHHPKSKKPKIVELS